MQNNLDPPPLKESQDRKIAKNTVLNLIGYGLPLLFALITIPILVKALGTDRFGVLTLVWVLISYIGLFDLGLSRALIQLVAEKLGAGNLQEIPALIWSGLFSMGGIGVIVGCFSALLLPFLIEKILQIPPELQKETLHAFYLISISVPMILLSVAFRGILDAYQRFDMTNMVRIPLGIFTFAAPLLVLPFSKSLFYIVGILLAGRAAAGIIQALLCLRVVPFLLENITIKRAQIIQLVKFGGWMTITNIISPLMVYIDRFFIGALLSVSAVAFYATPGEIVTKLPLISGAIMAVFFPAFSSSHVQDRHITSHLFTQGLKYVLTGVFPLSVMILLFASEGLHFWLGEGFARQSTQVLQILCVGAVFLCLGQVPYALIQGVGRPDITAKLHMVEVPFYMLLLYTLTRTFGLTGAAVAWSARLMIDSGILFYIALAILKEKQKAPGMIVAATGMSISFIIAALVSGWPAKIIFLCFFSPLSLLAGWKFILQSQDKKKLRQFIHHIFDRYFTGSAR